MQKQVSPKITAITFVILTISFLAAFYAIAWQEPTIAPPGGNIDAPLNTGPTGQSKVGGLILNTGNATTGLIVDNGEAIFETVTVIGGGSFPACDASYRGKTWLLQGGGGTEDGFYICKKLSDDTYSWKALASPRLIYGKRHSTGNWEVLGTLLKTEGIIGHPSRSDSCTFTPVYSSCGEVRTSFLSTDNIRYELALPCASAPFGGGLAGGFNIVLKDSVRMITGLITVANPIMSTGIINPMDGTLIMMPLGADLANANAYCQCAQHGKPALSFCGLNRAPQDGYATIGGTCLAISPVNPQNFLEMNKVECATDWFEDLKVE